MIVPQNKGQIVDFEIVFAVNIEAATTRTGIYGISESQIRGENECK